MTDLLLSDIFRNISYVTLIGLLVGAMFFVILGLREIREQSFSGVLYVVVGLFFLCSHLYYLGNIPPDSKGAFDTTDMSAWRWIATLMAPAIMALFIAMSLASFLRTRFKMATIEIFFGLTLFCYLYMLGSEWPTDMQAAVTSLYLFAFFKVELTTDYV
ncbi:MAG: hypothetical protein AAB305_02865 [Candidatus Zixiibacteriota bacterium]